MKRIIAITAAAVLLLALCLTGAAAEPSAAGLYTLFSIEMMGEQKTPESMGMNSVLTLMEDGSGAFAMNGEEEAVSKWSLQDGVLTLWNTAGVPQELRLENGIAEMELGGGVYFYYAREGVDTAGFTPAGHTPLSRLYAIFRDLDAKKGVHLSYEYHADYMDSTSVFDVHAKGSLYYSRRVTRAGGYEQLSANLFKDGTSYVLYPDEHRGSAATSTGSSLLADNVLLLDDFYQVLYQRAMRTDFESETRELDGKTWQVEFYPKENYTPDAAFYYNEDGTLAHILVGAPVMAPDMGETFYTLHGIDGDVDETLFDLSAYTIS